MRATIDGDEAARNANGPRDSRHRLEHVELIDRADTPGLAPSASPPACSRRIRRAFWISRCGRRRRTVRARWRDAHLWKTLADHGAPIAYASDWPVADISVMQGLQAALTRTPFGEEGTDERPGLIESLHAYMAGGAWAAHWDGLVGRLMPGLAADVVVIDGDIEAIPSEKLGAAGIALTVCGGLVTFNGAGFA